ncbi:DMT family transporter [Clostridium sp. YIM B02505]|uniref:DMT family transporter n=1 Tax=Clostridium yunnanense TaxID=2800325 RepID=A0ABS1EVC8_9CLOT|nr:DMT family transporter [Clostridium yunnanense]MBK1813334.1 DMT family transporter [Clostridium yunnanense]
MILYTLLAFLIGVNIVVNMMINGKLSQKAGMINGVLINYLMATLSSVILCTFMINSIPSYELIRSIPLPYFIGGFIGVLTTYIFNVLVPKVPAMYVVILRFIGQMFASAIIDYIYLDVFSKGKVIGAILFLIGLVLNARADNKIKKQLADVAITNVT